MSVPSLGAARSVFPDLILNGHSTDGLLDFQIVQSDHQIAGTFRATIALGADATYTARTLAAATDFFAELRIGIGIAGLGRAAAAWTSLISGPVDTISLDMATGTAMLCGRDLSAQFINSISAETFTNKTSSEIAQTLAARHGLNPVVSQTYTPIGRYYGDSHAQFSLYRSNVLVTEWDLLCGLAEEEGFDLYVNNHDLIFSAPEPSSLPVVIAWDQPGAPGLSLQTLRLDRSLGLAGDVSVTVQSWNSRSGSMISQTVQASPGANSSLTTSPYARQPSAYFLIRPNLSQDRALALATHTLAQISRHHRVLTMTMPGEVTLNPRTTIVLNGSDLAFDQPYVVDEVARRYSAHSGFIQTVRAVTTTG